MKNNMFDYLANNSFYWTWYIVQLGAILLFIIGISLRFVPSFNFYLASR